MNRDPLQFRSRRSSQSRSLSCLWFRVCQPFDRVRSCRSSVMNGQLFRPTNFVYWELHYGNEPRIHEPFHVAPDPRSNFLIEGIKRATAHKCGGCLDVQKADTFTNRVYMYIRFLIFDFLFIEDRIFVTNWIKSFVSSSGSVEKNRISRGGYFYAKFCRLEHGASSNVDDTRVSSRGRRKFISSISFEVIVDGVSFR